MNLKQAALVKPLAKTNRIIYDKVERDIEGVLEYVDYEVSGLFSVKQVGQVLVLLKVFT